VVTTSFKFSLSPTDLVILDHVVLKEYFVEHVRSFRYIEVDFGTQRFFVMKHSCSFGKHGEIYEEEKVDGECREIQDYGV
jgi:hypothetical protein